MNIRFCSFYSLALLLWFASMALGDVPGYGDSRIETFDTRDVSHSNENTSSLSEFDTRIIQGLYFSAESGDTTLDTGGSIGMPVLTGVLGPVLGRINGNGSLSVGRGSGAILWWFSGQARKPSRSPQAEPSYQARRRSVFLST